MIVGLSQLNNDLGTGDQYLKGALKINPFDKESLIL